MMRSAVASALVFCLMSSAAAAADSVRRDPTRIPAGAYLLDRRRASLVVKVTHVAGFRYAMRFTGVEGSFSYDPARWQATKVAITVDPKSIETKDNVFNKVVAGYFEPDKYPVIQFSSNSLVSDAEGRGQLTGDLTLHGVTRPVTLEVEFSGVEPGPMGAGVRMGFSGTGTIRRSDFGVNGGQPWVGDRIDLLFEVEFVKQ